MIVLVLDINNEALLRSLKENEQLKIVTGTIRRPKLYPIPDVILLNFDEVFGYNGREVTLIHLSSKLIHKSRSLPARKNGTTAHESLQNNSAWTIALITARSMSFYIESVYTAKSTTLYDRQRKSRFLHRQP